MSQRQENDVRHYTRYLKHGENIDRALTRLLEVKTCHAVYRKYETKRYASNYVHHREHESKSRSLIKMIDNLRYEEEQKSSSSGNRKTEKRRRNEDKSDRSSPNHSSSWNFAEMACERVSLKTLNTHRRTLESLSGNALLRVVEKNGEISREVDYMFRKLIKKDFPHRCFLLEDDRGATESYREVYERFVEDQMKDDRKEGPPSKKYKDQNGQVMHRVEKISFGEDDDDDYM